MSMVINTKDRYQKRLSMSIMYPSIKGKCSCGCGEPLTGRQTRWSSKTCMQKAYIKFAIIQGNTSVIRSEVFERDQGVCVKCGVIGKDWQADHILPVYKGGGGCSLDNIQTLCPYCHKEKTKKDLTTNPTRQ